MPSTRRKKSQPAIRRTKAWGPGRCRQCSSPIAQDDYIAIVAKSWYHQRCLTNGKGGQVRPEILAGLTPAQRLQVATANADTAARQARLPARKAMQHRIAANNAAIQAESARTIRFYGKANGPD